MFAREMDLNFWGRWQECRKAAEPRGKFRKTWNMRIGRQMGQRWRSRSALQARSGWNIRWARIYMKAPAGSATYEFRRTESWWHLWTIRTNRMIRAMWRLWIRLGTKR